MPKSISDLNSEIEISIMIHSQMSKKRKKKEKIYNHQKPP